MDALDFSFPHALLYTFVDFTILLITFPVLCLY